MTHAPLWSSRSRPVRFWIAFSAGLTSLLPGTLLAAVARNQDLFGIAGKSVFPEAGLIAVSLSLVPWTILMLVLQDRERANRASQVLLIWTYAFVTTVFLGSNGFVFARWPDPELGRMISEAALTAPGVVGMEFAPWTF